MINHAHCKLLVIGFKYGDRLSICPTTKSTLNTGPGGSLNAIDHNNFGDFIVVSKRNYKNFGWVRLYFLCQKRFPSRRQNCFFLFTERKLTNDKKPETLNKWQGVCGKLIYHTYSNWSTRPTHSHGRQGSLFCTCRPYFSKSSKTKQSENNVCYWFKTVGLAEWIIDDTCLVLN